MKLINKKNNQEIVGEIFKADAIFKRVRGLIGEKSPKALYLETRWGIHTFGVKFPLDVVILDSNWQVKKIISGLNPNGVFFWNPAYFRVLELPAGIIKDFNVSLGDYLVIE